MPQLDAMLRALAERGASELRLVDGAQPVFLFADGERPVSKAVLTRGQIVALLSELSPEEAPNLAAGRASKFGYRLGSGLAFVLEFDGSNGRGSARVAAAPTEASGVRPVAPGFSPTSVRPGAPAIEAYLAHMVELGASDLHVSAAEIPMLRVHGNMRRIAGASTCSPEESARLVFAMMPPRFKKEFEEKGDIDFAHEIPGVARFRCNVFNDRKGVGAVFRVIPSRIPTVDELGLSGPVVDLCALPKGLVLVTGPTGSGKSTTLAALVDHVNRTRSDHVITIEDPIEFVHANKSCLVNQREVGTHTASFRSALRAALREDPDIVLVGEMRDLETVAIAIETAETGHLVFGTLHTSTAPSTVDRIIDQFPADRQAQIRVMLSESLRGVVSQTLLRRIEGGRVAAMEVLIGTPAIANLIREGKTFQIPSLMQAGRKHGMLLMSDALADLVRRKIVSPEEAYAKTVDKAGLLVALRASGIDVAGAPSP